jgi:hypothetical protein
MFVSLPPTNHWARLPGALASLPAGTASATLTLKPTVARTGQAFLFAGLPAPNLRFDLSVAVTGEACYQFSETITTDAEGRFTISKVIPDAKYVAAWASSASVNRDYGNGSVTIDLAKLKPDEPIRFTVKQPVGAQ